MFSGVDAVAVFDFIAQLMAITSLVLLPAYVLLDLIVGAFKKNKE